MREAPDGLANTVRRRFVRTVASAAGLVLTGFATTSASRGGYREMEEKFEEKEHRLFGEHGFRQVVGQVADLERALGIHDLASMPLA